VCGALRRVGYQVIGVVRSADKGTELAKQEVLPVVATIDELKSLENHFDKADYVIDCVERGKDGMQNNEAIMAATVQASKRVGSKKTYVFTSGCMDYGDHPGKVIDESADCKQKILQKRIDYCNKVIKADQVNGIVVRPGFVYGTTYGVYVNSWFQTTGEIVVQGNPDKTWPWIHIYDLADFYVKLLQTPKAYGQVFDVSDDTRVTYKDARVLFARAAGNKDKVKLVGPEGGDWGVIMETSMTTSSNKAKTLLGWEPKLGPLQEEMSTSNCYNFYKAWSASTKSGH